MEGVNDGQLQQSIPFFHRLCAAMARTTNESGKKERKVWLIARRQILERIFLTKKKNADRNSS